MVQRKIIEELIKSRLKNRVDLDYFKRRVSKKYKISCPSNIELLKAYHRLIERKSIKRAKIIENLLITRPVRSLSGIVNVSVLTKPYPCPGRCLYCPIEKGIPKSYVSGEPAVERAKRLNYNPYLQVKKRIEMLKLEGHPTDKIELRIIGGTWSYYPRKYQDWFIKRCFLACNNKNSKLKTKKLKDAQQRNEKAKHRIVGLSVETRPDFINEKEIKWLRELGVTMVEFGVQSIYDDVLKLNLRGHGIKETILATKLLKDAGFKVLYQMMPNLPGSNLKRDEKMFEELFKNPDFQPDLLKIYPCALLKEAPLYKWWKAGKYKPYAKTQLINLIKEIKKKIPYYVRIQRIIRDIPSPRVISGAVRISNLRQILKEEIKKDGWQCKCIRCREIREKYNPKEKIILFRQNYNASGGKEIFLSFENENRTKLYALLRLRITSDNTAIIREIHTYGQLQPLQDSGELFSAVSPPQRGEPRSASLSGPPLQASLAQMGGPQHKGLGRKLVKKAEKIAKNEFGLNKISVISAVGTRDYFRKSGYSLKNTYMVKNL